MKKHIIFFLSFWLLHQGFGQWMSNGTAIFPNTQNTTKNVGIGTISPNSRLHVHNPVNGDAIINVTTSNVSNAGISFGQLNTNNNFSIFNAGADLYFRSYLASPYKDLMVININGNIGIGTNSPTQRFHVFNGITHGTYTTSGWAHSSDKRLKTSIQAISNPMEIVNNLKGVWYEWKNNKEAGRQVGFLAQDVQKVLPEVVVGVEGDIEKGEMLGMAYQNIVPILVEALKEQQKMIESLQKEVNLLKIQK